MPSTRRTSRRRRRDGDLTTTGRRRRAPRAAGRAAGTSGSSSPTSATPSTKRTWRGTLKLGDLAAAERDHLLARRARARGRARRTRPAPRRSRASGTPTTCASLTAGCVARNDSISTAATFSPPTLSMSLSRPWKVIRPSASIEHEVAGVEAAVVVDRRARRAPRCRSSRRSGSARGRRARRARPAGSSASGLGVDDAHLEAGQRPPAGADARLDGVVELGEDDGPAELGDAVGAHQDRRRVRRPGSGAACRAGPTLTTTRARARGRAARSAGGASASA